jgi:Cu2+-containing amine oxidase
MRRLGLAGVVAVVGLRAAAAAAVCSTGTELVQSFPTSGGAVSEWKLCWGIQRMPDADGALDASETLVISEATFRPGAAADPVDVLGELRMSEIFVPYDAGEPRFTDLTDFGFDLVDLTATECTGTLLASDRVCREVLDRELAWRNPEAFPPVARRGEKLVLWSILNAGNYDYVMYYAFYDDGTIEVRAGSTGQKLGGPDDTDGHTHLFAWRIDLDVAGPGGDTVSVSNQNFSGKSVREKEDVITTESGINWSAANFTHVEVEDATRTNGNGRHTGYALEPMRSGLPKFKEAFSRFPIAVTRAHAAGEELRAFDLPSYLNKESVAGQNVVLWYLDAHHHEENMRDEDRDTVPVLWVGFRLQPQNLWDGTPFYP